MNIEIKEITPGNVNELPGRIGKSPKKTIARYFAKLKRGIAGKSSKKTIARHFGKLKRGIDGMDYQKSIRNEWR